MDRQEYYRQYNAKRKEKMADYDRNRPDRKERVAKFKEKRQANPEFWREYSNMNYHKNKNNDRPCNTKEYKMWWAAKKRANAKDIPFDIERSDVIITDDCPCCLQPMIRPSLDKVKPDKGYTKGNVVVICYDCNVIKSFGDADRHRQIADFIDKFNLVEEKA